MKRLSAASWVVVFLSACGGCLHEGTSAERAASVREALTEADRARALGPATTRGTGFLLTAPGLVVTVDRNDVETENSTGHTWIGCSVVLGRDGYLATAAHLVGNGPIVILTQDGSQFTARPARVVFRGNADFDFALLHVTGSLSDAFEWAPADTLGVGTPLVGVGAHPKTDSPTRALWLDAYAGRLSWVERRTSSAGAYTEIGGTLPARSGDSGGPWLTADGRLVGVLSRRSALGFTSDGRSQAIRPDLGWLRRTINADRRAHTATSRP